MDKDVIICIGTIGSVTFNKCLSSIEHIAKKNSRVSRVAVIKNKRPQSAWLNEMRIESSGAKWCLQVDEDMYLYPNALDELLKFAEKESANGIRVLNASSLLYDLFLESNIGSLKLWSVDSFKNLEFRDVLGGDRDFAKRASSLGFKNIQTNIVLGDHDSAPTPAIAFKKYFEYTQKIKKFSGDKSARNFNSFLKNKWLNSNDYISKKAYDGSSLGVRMKVKNKSKR